MAIIGMTATPTITTERGDGSSVSNTGSKRWILGYFRSAPSVEATTLLGSSIVTRELTWLIETKQDCRIVDRHHTDLVMGDASLL
jgi:hypothetical protein